MTGVLLRDTGNNAIPGFRMRLSCPACQTEYDVPDAALTGRSRTLRCGRCDHQWRVAPLDLATAGAASSSATRDGGDFTGMPLPEPPPRLALTAERPAAPVSFVAEPPTPAAASSKRKFPIPDPPRSESERFDPNSTAKLTYGTAGYDYNNNLPGPRQASGGANPWLVSILLLLIAIVMVWVERAHVMRAWPPSTRLFDAITALLQRFLPHK